MYLSRENKSQRTQPHTLPSLTSQRQNQSLAKSVSAPTHGRKRNNEGTTMAIRNAGESANMKVITLNKLTAKRKVKCLEIPHYA